ncbi:hypothetical protein SDC9_197853 [bioreactor metagenome]|uniref:Uncharacterized protein n=1 Tax=bioreactor metagenome TaxID=1076179 RepID=A0A645IG07_9ZZZZ
MQYLSPPFLFGPSLNTCPRCASPDLLRTSVRTIPYSLSSFSDTTSGETGAEKLGHPHPLSNLSEERKSGSPVVTSTYSPFPKRESYSPVNGGSVAPSRVTEYCTLPSSFLNCSSVLPGYSGIRLYRFAFSNSPGSI